MPTLKSIREATDKVIIERGPIRLELDCYLERISAENEDYAKLGQAGRESRMAQSEALLQLGLHSNEYWLTEHIEELAKKYAGVKTGSKKSPSDEDYAKAREEFSAEVSRLIEEQNAQEAKVLRNQAERIAYLVSSWDITDEDGKPIPVTADVLVKELSPTLIHHIIEEVEGAVFGPLGTKPSTTS